MFQQLYEIRQAIRGSPTEVIDGVAQTNDWNMLLALMPLVSFSGSRMP